MRTRTLEQIRAAGHLQWFAPALERLRALRDDTNATLRTWFDPHAPFLIARAPGRLDVMGGIADYSGALVLELPLQQSTFAILQAWPPDSTAGTSASSGSVGSAASSSSVSNSARASAGSGDTDRLEILTLRGRRMQQFGMDLAALERGPLSEPLALRTWITRRAADRWAAYVVGVLYASLMHSPHHGARAPGFRLLIESQVPAGKGVSSSAALEVACMNAIAAFRGDDMDAESMAAACQWAENHIAGAPCGIMDQMTAACGRRDRLLRLRCQPATIEGHIEVPPGYRFYGIDSGIRHAVTGESYGTVRTAAFMGYRLIAGMAGLPAVTDAGRVRVDDPRWHGYLANLTPTEFAEQFEPRLPARMHGAEFLARYAGITDTVTRVAADRHYPVRQATAHAVYENARVEHFAGLLDQLSRTRAPEPPGATSHTLPLAREMGRLMYASHESYSACGLGSEGTDQIVRLVSEAGEAQGLFGAKITGGGSGGTVAILGTITAEAAVREIARRYMARSGRTAEVFVGSGPGADETGVLALVPGDSGVRLTEYG